MLFLLLQNFVSVKLTMTQMLYCPRCCPRYCILKYIIMFVWGRDFDNDYWEIIEDGMNISVRIFLWDVWLFWWLTLVWGLHLNLDKTILELYYIPMFSFCVFLSLSQRWVLHDEKSGTPKHDMKKFGWMRMLALLFSLKLLGWQKWPVIPH